MRELGRRAGGAPGRGLLDDPAKLLRRRLADRAAGGLIRFLGIAVIGITALILVYLGVEVAPLLASAGAEPGASWPVAPRQTESRPSAPGGPSAAPSDAPAAMAPTVIAEAGDLALTPDLQGHRMVSLRWQKGEAQPVRSHEPLDLPDDFAPVRAWMAGQGGSTWLITDAGGRFWALQANFRRGYGDSDRIYREGVTEADYAAPLGGEPLDLGLGRQAGGAGEVAQAALVRARGELLGIAAAHPQGLALGRLRRGGGLSFGGPAPLRLGAVTHIPWPAPVVSVAALEDGALVWVDAQGGIGWADARVWGGGLAQPNRLPSPADACAECQGLGRPAQVLALLGNRSLVVADDGGGLVQLRQRAGAPPQWGRAYEPMPAAVRAMAAEGRRKGFWALDAQGNLGAYYLNRPDRMLEWHVPRGEGGDGAEWHEGAAPGGGGEWGEGAEQAIGGGASIAIAPRLDQLLVSGGGRAYRLAVDNEHPEATLRLLWGKVLYEGYDEPRFVWQSSAATTDFEPKLSLVPLVMGTLKGALYAMLFAVPLALLGALYTAQFMSSRGRGLVKPAIEIMGAFPTVVLGFLGGLWLAPIVEGNLLGALLAPPALLAALAAGGLGAALLPPGAREPLQGREYLLAAPLCVLAVWAALTLGEWVQLAWFGGNFAVWMDQAWGVSYAQRNGLIVGMAMGFAVIPIVYSVSEDALYEVPRRLTEGGLALGATPWQTAMRIVVPTASAGIFAALMIGMGRAVGETMIVVMATGNTPIMDMDLFSGMRTLSANIAVEMPEAEIGSTHYHLLFLSAFLLLSLTFVVNTLAELVRERLRARYASL